MAIHKLVDGRVSLSVSRFRGLRLEVAKAAVHPVHRRTISPVCHTSLNRVLWVARLFVCVCQTRLRPFGPTSHPGLVVRRSSGHLALAASAVGHLRVWKPLAAAMQK